MPKVTRTCLNCATAFQHYPSQGPGRFCSKSCTNVSAQRIRALERRGVIEAQPLDHRLIPLTGDAVCRVDTDDYDRLMTEPWTLSNKGYVVRTGRHRHQLHRAIMEHHLGRKLGPAEDIDHRNHDPLDNRKQNLRLVDDTRNRHNCRPFRGSSSKFKGVSWSERRERWEVSIKPLGRSIWIGTFDDEEEAAYIYDQFALALYGEYAYLNLLDHDQRAS